MYSGSFGSSCSDVILTGTVLSASCLNTGGGSDNTSIDTSKSITVNRINTFINIVAKIMLLEMQMVLCIALTREIYRAGGQILLLQLPSCTYLKDTFV